MWTCVVYGAQSLKCNVDFCVGTLYTVKISQNACVLSRAYKLCCTQCSKWPDQMLKLKYSGFGFVFSKELIKAAAKIKLYISK